MAEVHSQTQTDHFGTLTAQVTSVLVQTGKFFRDSGNTAKWSKGMKDVIPDSYGRFHDALDDLEIQILDAKAVLERDLRAIRAKNAPKESSILDTSTTKMPPEDLTKHVAEVPDTNQDEASKPIQGDVEDVVTRHNPAADVDEQSTARQEEARDPKTEEIARPSKNATESQPQPSAEANDVQGNPREKAKENIMLQTDGLFTDDVAAFPPGEEAAMSAVSHDINFESMFGEPTGGSGGNDLDFGIDLTGGQPGDTNFLANDDSFAPVINEKDPATPNSFLPVLENYANAAGDDFNMLDLPPASNSEIAVTKNIFDDLPQTVSNFDDMFLDTNFGGAMGDGEDLLNDDALVEIGDLDDSWLN